MTHLDVHPEHLLDEALRSGRVTPALREHLELCDDCCLELEVGLHLRKRHSDPTESAPIPAERVEQVVHATMHQLAAEGLLRSKAPAPEVRRPLDTRAVIAAAILCSAAAAAAANMWWRNASSDPATSPGLSSGDPKRNSQSLAPREAPGREKSMRSANGKAEPSFRALPPLQPEARDPVTQPAVAPKPSATVPDVIAAKPKLSPISARELFEQASRANAEGRFNEAAKLYQELQRRFEASPEAQVSRVALGRLLLLKAPARALEQFDQYLARGGTMAPEAYVGRARALQRLGRLSEERTAWRQLLARYPQSAYVHEAQERLQVK